MGENASELIAIRGGDFSATAVRDRATITTYLKGSADGAATEALAKLVVGLHQEAQRAPTSEAVVDLRELEFMNSSCLKSFVTWIANVRQLETERQYRIRFVANASVHWQRRSLNALRCFATDLITIDNLSQ
jgi:hypothetical protein